MRKALVALAILCGVIVVVVFVRTALLQSKQVEATPASPLAVDTPKAAARLSRAIQLETISSRSDPKNSADAFEALHAHFAASFPVTHASLARETVSGLSLLYAWRGTDPSLRPILLAAHMDVVPADGANWTHSPFAGRIADGFVWGRGAIDDKASVMGILEAVELLLGVGFSPRRTIYIAFGHDEEVGGGNGAAAVAALLRSRGVELEFVLDEGGAITTGIVPLERPAATVGIAEKGYLTLQLSVAAPGGHSMNPPQRTAIGTLSRAVSRLEARPFPARIDGATRELLEHIGPESPFLLRMSVANLWLFSPLVESRLTAKPSSNAAIRTTIAATMIEGGVRENVLPTSAKATVNFRILPGERVHDVLERVRRTVDDEAVDIEITGKAFEPSPVSSTRSYGFTHLARTIRSIFPDAVVAPYLVPGATDARHYATVARDIYRFLPLAITADDLSRFHGVDERISIESYANLIRFYAQFVRTLD
jgi:carboxypeptidase PM20D1